MTDIMVDLECLSTRPHAAIVVIAAIRFKRGCVWDKKVNINTLNKNDIFYQRIDINSCLEVGLHIDENTENWWKHQDKALQYEALYHPNRVNLVQALQEFKEWFGTDTWTKIWGNGSGFDCTILGEAYKRCGMIAPWKFWMERDLRTIMDLARLRASDLPQDNKHHALYDCYNQIIGFQMCEKILGLS